MDVRSSRVVDHEEQAWDFAALTSFAYALREDDIALTILRVMSMILQPGEERDDAVRREPRGFGEAMRRVDVPGIGQLIQTARKPDEVALFAQAR